MLTQVPVSILYGGCRVKIFDYTGLKRGLENSEVFH